MVEAMSSPAEVLKLQLHSRRLPEQLDHARSNELGTKASRSLFHRELDDMSDGTGHPKYFTFWYAAQYNEGVIPVLTRYLDSRNYEGVRRKRGGSGSWIYEVVS